MLHPLGQLELLGCTSAWRALRIEERDLSCEQRAGPEPSRLADDGALRGVQLVREGLRLFGKRRAELDQHRTHPDSIRNAAVAGGRAGRICRVGERCWRILGGDEWGQWPECVGQILVV